MSAKLCPCGLPDRHYRSAEVQAFVEKMVREHGETVVVTVEGRSWRVPRHYIALHGLRAAELETLGFEEVTRPAS